ncbi:carbohydrate kinase family protein [Candidatus Woesearchaeota archaeon CG_4_10_14_0_2_um_filter_33_10]|nr:MAG: carbohydrate kinase family protein [Candidatus Woesearchaeota archaeon CG10_big_fil_rev_8_21_14_0_10_33_12]PIZ53723.1 MAG: carbohydrate kinase family protein [Candidatus Woesearchaeota archaeon CG_4_10_14_0_2_um_filter_33_10]
MSRMYDIITVGSATVDVFANTESELIKIKTSNSEEELIAYPSGSKILIKELRFTTGGGGTNTAVSLARLGHKVGYLGSLGNDENGRKILDLLKKEKIDFIGKLINDTTGYSIILDSIEHDRTILTYKGANDKLKFSDINLKKLKTKWFYFSSMISESFKTLEKLAEFAEKNKINIAFNPSTYLAKKGIDYLKKILTRTSILILNNEEALLLVGKNNVKTMLKELYKLGPEIIIITDGKKAINAYDGKNIYVLIPNKIRVVESTGAGDAFASSFLSGMIKKNNVDFALRLGLVNSESVIQKSGAKNKLLKYREALEIIKKSPIKIKKLS